MRPDNLADVRGVEAPPTAARPEALDRIAEIALAHAMPRVAEEAERLAERVAEGRFHVACVGQFKRGKSTLLNALLGEEVLPAGVVPVTAVPTVLRWSPEPKAIVRTTDGTTLFVRPPEIGSFVAESENPDNVKRVEVVELLLPSMLLRNGMCLVDTPGLGSVFEVATGATRAFLPNMDAALVVLGADPPISADEVAMVETAARQVEDILVVLTKADRATDEERREAADFTRRVLTERLGRDPGPILQVSALERLRNGATRDWDALVSRLGDLSERSKGRIVEAARRRGIRRMTETLLARVRHEREALLLPREESARRLDALAASARAIGERLRHLEYLFNAEQGRVRLMLYQRRSDFLDAALPTALERLDAEMERLRGTRGPVLRRRIAEFLRETAREALEPWLVKEEAEAEALYLSIAGRFVEIANGFLDAMEPAGEMGLERLPAPLAADTQLRAGRGYSFKRFDSQFVSALPIQWVADALTPPPWNRRRIRREARSFLVWLMEANSSRVQNDLIERVSQSRRTLEREIRSILEEAGRWADAMIRRIQETQAAGADAVRSAVAELDRVEEELERIRGAEGEGA